MSKEGFNREFIRIIQLKCKDLHRSDKNGVYIDILKAAANGLSCCTSFITKKYTEEIYNQLIEQGYWVTIEEDASSYADVLHIKWNKDKNYD